MRTYRRRQRLRVGTDADAVVYEFDRAMAEWVHLSTGRPRSSMPPATGWDFWEAWGMARREFLGHFEAGVRAGWLFRHGPAVPGAVEAIRRITVAHDLVVVTNRDVFGMGELALASTRAWFADQGMPVPEIVLAADKAGLGLDLHLDDAAHVIEAMRAQGERVVAFSRPWNAHLSGERANTWADYEALVEQASAGSRTAWCRRSFS